MADPQRYDRAILAAEAAEGWDLGAAIPTHSVDDVAAACAGARAAFQTYRSTPPGARAAFLRCIGREIMVLGEELIATAARETGLSQGRLAGERGRTVAQLELFAGVVEAERWLDIRIDEALPDRLPAPRPDLRSRRMPLGPVAVFGASNFPLAFSTAGGDTASALAAGCPVVVKGHPAHPRTGALMAEAIWRAAASETMPQGVFNHVVGPSLDLGQALVRDPRIAAVGFTGSRQGGLALLAVAQSRPAPIPVFAEMASINPVVLLPHALAARPTALADDFVQSLLLGAGQFCTNPGLVIAIEGEGLETFLARAATVLSAAPGQPMLTPAIQYGYSRAAEMISGHEGVEVLARGPAEERAAAGRAALFKTSAAHFIADAGLSEEMFGPASLVVLCKTEHELHAVIGHLEGQLTLTLQLDEQDHGLAQTLLPICEEKAGRLICNGWPTGVEVCHAMVHGGPFPATSDGRSSSVGSLAIERFTRPVCYQNFPAMLLPTELAPESGAPSLQNGLRV